MFQKEAEGNSKCVDLDLIASFLLGHTDMGYTVYLDIYF